MKFKAFLTENGVNLLEKRFLPAFDKMGKNCHLLLTKEHLFFLHNLLNGDGVQCIAQFRKDVLFDDYRISSQNEDRIAFSLDVSLLYRAVMPFLTFETKGYKSAVIQDVPISKLLSRSQVIELQTALDSAQDLPPTLVQVQDPNQLQNFVDHMRHVGDVLNVTISKHGDLQVPLHYTNMFVKLLHFGRFLIDSISTVNSGLII